ncbi:hypothetical protein [Mycolicibacterium sp. CBMA 361]|uniref:hypothetical protein n=1 Tax=Mycolicibacterium sp. CBMA 361 TaxID=2606610 RepID=UPI001EF004B4|nr:hypothetical protein [Mycolicibacterium sp. CBMA 361]
MTKFLVPLLAVAGLALAPVAQASESAFVSAVDSLGHFAIGCPGCASDALNVGYHACAAWDRGGKQAAIQAVRKFYNADSSDSADYYATLFAQYAGQTTTQPSSLSTPDRSCARSMTERSDRSDVFGIHPVVSSRRGVLYSPLRSS